MSEKYKMNFNSKLELKASSYVRNFIKQYNDRVDSDLDLISFQGERRDFDHPVVDSHCLTPKRTLDEFYPLSHDNEILMYNAICILNNRIIEAEYWHFKLLDKINNLEERLNNEM